LGLKQAKKLSLKTVLESAFQTISIKEPTPPEPVPPVPPPIFPTRGEKKKYIKTPRLKRKRRIKLGKPKKPIKKTVFAGFWKVQESLIKYGKATHPRPTKKIWKMGERLGWRIPTVELIKEKEKKEKVKFANLIKRERHYKKKKKKKRKRRR
jgi:hypothetical protein